MFKKKQPTSGAGRQRPIAAPERRSSAVFSYHAGRAARPQGGNLGRSIVDQQAAVAAGAAAARRGHSHPLLKRLPATLGLVLLAMLLLSSLYVGSSPHFMVATGTNKLILHNQAVYEQAAHDILGRSLANRTKLTVNTDAIAKQLSDKFPELGVVTVTLPVFGHQPQVLAQGAQAALIMSIASGQSYVLDTTGRALAPTAQVPVVAKLNLPTVGDQSGLPVTVGKVALPSSTVSFIREVVGQLQANHLTISSLTLPAGNSELDVKINGAGYYVKFNVRGDPRAEAGTFVAVKLQLERTGKSAGTYIDVRVDGRAYYK